MTRVLVVDDDRSIRRSLEKFLTGEGLDVITAGDGPEAMRVAPGADVILLDLGLPGADGFEVLTQVRATPHPPPVIVVTARDDMQSTVKAIQLGAYEYLVKPIDIDRLRLVVRRAAESRDAERTLGQFVARESETFQVGNIIGKSAPIREVYKQIGAVSTSKASVLMLGESGTGKELVAKAIHYASADRDKPFVAINCTAFAPGVLESELFGHVKGAFTGAIGDKVGRFELAGTGTLFLDEIGELPHDLQPQLLRALEKREVRRVGETKPIPVDLRVIAATHRDLRAMVKAGSFREDLYYRLAVVRCEVPPLRSRLGDLPTLARHFAEAFGSSGWDVSPALLEQLSRHAWPGNVRELRNVVERALSLGTIAVDNEPLPPGIAAQAAGQAGGPGVPASSTAILEMPFKEAKAALVEGFERDYLVHLLARHKGNISRAALEAGIDRNYIHRLVKKYGLDVERS